MASALEVVYKASLDKFNVLTGDLVRNGKGDYTITPYTLRDGSKWDKTTDNFYQNHNILRLPGHLAATGATASHCIIPMATATTRSLRTKPSLPSWDSFTRMQRATRLRNLTSSARGTHPAYLPAWYTNTNYKDGTGMLSAD